MVKYIKFTKVEKDNTILTFIQKTEDVKVNYFDVDVVTLIGEENAINELIESQPPEINCEEITKDECWELVKNTSQIKNIYRQANELFKKEVKAIADLYTPEERETWNIQLEEAKRYIEDNTAEVPFLEQCASAADMTLEDYANLVINKDKEYKNMAANALAKRLQKTKELMSEIGL